MLTILKHRIQNSGEQLILNHHLAAALIHLTQLVEHWFPLLPPESLAPL